MSYLSMMTPDELFKQYRWEQLRTNSEDRKLNLSAIRAEIFSRLKAIDEKGIEDRKHYEIER